MTPRTDELEIAGRQYAGRLNEAAKRPGGVSFTLPDPNAPMDAWEFARQLEREHAALTAEVRDLKITDDVTMTGFSKLEKMFKQQVLRAEAAEAQVARASDYIVECSNDQIGGGDDPVRFLIASHGTLVAQVAELKKDAAYWLIFFEDADRRSEIFTEESAARKRFEQISASWNATLFRSTVRNFAAAKESGVSP